VAQKNRESGVQHLKKWLKKQRKWSPEPEEVAQKNRESGVQNLKKWLKKTEKVESRI